MPEIRVVVPEGMDRVLDSLVRSGFAGNKAELVRSAIIQLFSSLPTLISKDYDTQTLISPDGRILQLEYAIEAAKRGNLTTGVWYNEGIVLIKRLPVGDTSLIPLLMPKPYFRPTHYITDNIAIGFSGLTMDARLVLREALNYVEQHDKEQINICHLAEELTFFVHSHTLKKDIRVLGACFIIGGLDTDNYPRLFGLEPAGSIFESKAFAIGNGHEEATKILVKGYTKSMNLEKAIILGMKAALQGKKDPENLLIDIIDTQSKKFRELTLEEKKNYFDKFES
ncbi:MAG: hypothetical protein ACFFBD_29825 [Candidatus Hodarchaeota archaeon]